MRRFIVLSFLVLGWGYYELSGGADFRPRSGGDAPVVPDQTRIADAPDDAAIPPDGAQIDDAPDDAGDATGETGTGPSLVVLSDERLPAADQTPSSAGTAADPPESDTTAANTGGGPPDNNAPDASTFAGTGETPVGDLLSPPSPPQDGGALVTGGTDPLLTDPDVTAADIIADLAATGTVSPPPATTRSAASSNADPSADIRRVTASRVNMRAGPGTDYSVLGTLGRGAEAQVVAELGNGWVQLIVLDLGAEGYMAARLLSDPAD